MKINKFLLGILTMMLSVSSVIAEVRLPSILADRMVIQQNSTVNIWGWAEPGEHIYVVGSWQKSSISAVADEAGKWILQINSPDAGGPYEIIIEGKNKIILHDVMAGEVWFASGQSNMAMALEHCENAETEIAAAVYPQIRLFHVQHIYNERVQEDCQGEWVDCNPQTAATFSAVAYYFGRKLHKDLSIPVGLIGSEKGGTPAEAWMSVNALKSASLLSELNEMWRQWEIESSEHEKSYNISYKKWLEEKQLAEKSGRPIPKTIKKPTSLDMVSKPHRRPGALYNAMVAPLQKFKIKGVIWYQGENNVSRPFQYGRLFPTLIKSWRIEWQKEDLPFYFVQIAPYKYKSEEKAASLLRESQTMTLSVPYTGMAVTVDIGNIDDIHPKNKKDVGERLSLWALAKDYRLEEVVYSGPMYRSMKIENKGIRLYFEYAESGLDKRGETLTHFEIAGENRIFYPAMARIEGETVFVRSEKVVNPIAVRYAWWISAIPNLYNGGGLPAVSFRTDNWDLPEEK